MANLYRKSLLSFSECTDATDGVIWKAGFQDSDLDADGVGANGTITDVAGILDFTEGGITTSATNNTGATKVEITIPAANQSGLRFSGRVQFEVKSSYLLAMLTQGRSLWSMRDAANAQQGPAVEIHDSTARNSGHANTYIRTFNYGALQLDATWAPNQLGETNNALSVYLNADTKDWWTVTMSWEGGFMWWSVDGHTVSRNKHAAFTADPTYIRMDMVSTDLADRLPIRNMILCDHPAPDTTKQYVGRTIAPIVLCMGHSFWNERGGMGEWAYDSTERTGSLEHLTSQIHYQYLNNYGACTFINVAHDGSVTAATTVIEGHAEAMTPSQLTYDYTDLEVIPNRILRWGAHIALLMVHGSNTNAQIATVNTSLTAILDALKADGIIPIVIREQNRDAGGQDRQLVDAQVQTTVTNWRAANGGDDSCGIVNMWTPTGGSTVNTDYVESSGTLIHPSLDVGPLYGANVSAAIWYAANNPPSYARWQGY